MYHLDQLLSVKLFTAILSKSQILQIYLLKTVNKYFIAEMQYSSRGGDQKQASSSTLRESYNSTNMQRMSASSSQIVDQIRKKYDTPTRRQLKQIQTKSLADRPQSYGVQNNMKRSTANLYCNSNISSVSSININNENSKWGVTLGQSKFVEMSPGFRKENVNGQEQTIFRRIKEMKDSLLNKNDKIKTTKSIYEPRYSEKAEIRTNDSRVENIDKINSKIQQILHCLKQSQAKTQPFSGAQPSFTPISQLKSVSKPPLQTSISSRPPMPYTTSSYTRVSQFNNSSINQINNTSTSTNIPASRCSMPVQSKPPSASASTNVQVKNTTSIYQEEKNRYKMVSPVPKGAIQGFDIASNRGDRQGSKVKSFISSVQKQNTVSFNKYQMKNGKKLDDQISKIQQKIQQFEQQKRRLNIQFKPYSHSTSKSSTNLAKRSYTIDKQIKPALPRQQSATPSQSMRKGQETYSRRITGSCLYDKLYKDRDGKDKLKTSDGNDYQPRISFEPKKDKNVENTQNDKKYDSKDRTNRTDRDEDTHKQSQQNSLFKLKLIPVESEQKSSSSSRIQVRMLSDDFKRKTDQGINDRKKKLTNQQSTRSRATIKKLVQKLTEQASRDEKLRNNKLYFESNMEPSKWQQLEQELKKHGVKLTRQKLHESFKVTDEQNNPFFSVRESQSSLPALASSYVQCQKHWQQQIYKKLSKQQLIAQQLTANTFDLQKKGYLVLQDIVRFLNMETGIFYRNRDLFLIFRRISEQQKITFDQLMSAFCSNA